MQNSRASDFNEINICSVTRIRFNWWPYLYHEIFFNYFLLTPHRLVHFTRERLTPWPSFPGHLHSLWYKICTTIFLNFCL
jgi:hypothetical protein